MQFVITKNPATLRTLLLPFCICAGNNCWTSNKKPTGESTCCHNVQWVGPRQLVNWQTVMKSSGLKDGWRGWERGKRELKMRHEGAALETLEKISDACHHSLKCAPSKQQSGWIYELYMTVNSDRATLFALQKLGLKSSFNAEPKRLHCKESRETSKGGVCLLIIAWPDESKCAH